MCHTDTVDCSPPPPPLQSRILARKVLWTKRSDWMTVEVGLRDQLLDMNSLVGFLLRFNQLYCRFIEKSEQQHLIWFLVTCRLQGPSPGCPGRASMSVCVCVFVHSCQSPLNTSNIQLTCFLSQTTTQPQPPPPAEHTEHVCVFCLHRHFCLSL